MMMTGTSRQNERTSALALDQNQTIDTSGLNRYERFARVLDTQFRVPGINFRIGLDGIMGLIPVVGDTLTAGMGLYALQLANEHKLPTLAKIAIVRNIAMDWLIGLIPLVGDIFDFAFHAHAKNAKILRKHTAHHE